MSVMGKLIDEFRLAWRGISPPSPLLGIGFAAGCLALSTAARWGLAQVRPDVFFTVFSGRGVCHRLRRLPARLGTALAGGVLGMALNFGETTADFARLALLAAYLIACGLTIWGVEHYRSIASQQREISKRLIREEEYRKLIVGELQHRLKNKLSTIHAVLHQVLHDRPEIWAGVDQRLRALARTDDLIARVEGRGCDVEEGPAGLRARTLRTCAVQPER